jgi:tetratricopeptide (TPR) repeat protein
VRFLVGACALIAGCAGKAPLPTLATVPELTDVPFFAQTEYQCGPAALATILNTAGVAVTPTELIDAVYVEGLKGSLQPELTAATRRYGLLPLPVAPDAQSLFAEVADGRPALVMQNLGVRKVPVWHYAVVVGFDADAGEVILRSGTEQRRLESLRQFLRSWQLADNWAFVATEPATIPATAQSDIYMRALVGAEPQLGDATLERAYSSALARWPDDPFVLFLAALREHAKGHRANAAKLYRQVLARDPDHAAARNNLANALFEQGCRTEALQEARAALDREPPDGEFHAAILDTVREIEESAPRAEDPALCPAAEIL